MTDEELLTFAAKAAGIEGKWQELSNPYGGVYTAFCTDYGWGDEWHPLNDDGDALRLAVKLGMRTHNDGSCANAELPTGQKHCWTEAAVVESNDHYAATRRAIVRAAAEIGKGME